MRLLFECTYVFDHPHANSGIQRVVRSVVNQLAQQETDVECLPVILKNDRIYEVRKLAPEFRDRVLSGTQAWLDKNRNRHWLLHHRLEQRFGLKRVPALRLAFEIAFRLATLWFNLPFILVLLAISPDRIDARLWPRFERYRNRYWLAHHQLEQRFGLKRQPSLRLACEIAFRLGSLSFILPFGLLMLVTAPQRIDARARPGFQHFRNLYWQVHQRLEQRLGLSRIPAVRWLFRQACRAGSLTFMLPWKFIVLLSSRDADRRDDSRARDLACGPGDVLVLLDSSWHADFFVHAERLKAEGVGIVAVVYDLIPLTHPQFCDPPLVRVFDRWFEWVAKTADGFIAISETISRQVREDVVRRLGLAEANKRWYSHFHLGSELDRTSQAGQIRQGVLSLFTGKRAVYLMVSTIEPRKNHAYLLDAFEQLWAAGSPVVLCIIGRVGWKCAPLIARIKKHPELRRRLFMFNDLSDTELEFCYQKGRALVFPSFVEGFGLPLVEAMQRGLPAMASDIPVFHEIGENFLAYFDLNDPATLAALVRKFEDSGKFPAARALNEWSWPGWHGSTRQLIQRIVSNTLERQPATWRIAGTM